MIAMRRVSLGYGAMSAYRHAADCRAACPSLKVGDAAARANKLSGLAFDQLSVQAGLRATAQQVGVPPDPSSFSNIAGGASSGAVFSDLRGHRATLRP